MAQAADDRADAQPLRSDFSLGERTGYLLHKASMVLEADVEQALAEIGLRARDFFVLAALAGGVPLSQQDLSRLLGLDPTTVVAVIDDLEGREYVERRRNPADRRRYNLILTDAGSEALREADRAATEAETAFLGQLDDDERALLHAMLGRTMSGRWPAAVVSPD